MLAEELAEFARCIRGETEPETGAEEGIAALRCVLDAVACATEEQQLIVDSEAR
jgi:predicted dehydrogenase